LKLGEPKVKAPVKVVWASPTGSGSQPNPLK